MTHSTKLSSIVQFSTK